ncbi:MOLPALP family lipoprotein [Spiroplasma endosymbiont of Panorpa germanica]|uniref:MOLPALP family lipoprotein n=1 Tax=Spiroplasma endosymbiont of Panorpa germanica TaxID=3066314 RepID=UPI0030CC8312
MKKLLSILGTLAIVTSTSTSVIACQAFSKVSKVSKEVKSLAEVFSYYGRALILNQEEDINLDYTMGKYKSSKAGDLLKNYNGNKSTNFSQVLNSTFGKNTNFNNFINETNENNNVQNIKGKTPQSAFANTISGLMSTILVVFGGGFNQKTASTLTTILTSDAIGGILNESMYQNFSKIMTANNINAIGEIFDFKALEGQNQQFAINYSINQITLALAKMTNTSIMLDGGQELTSTTPIKIKGSNATNILTNIFDGIIRGSKKVSISDGDLIYVISKLVNAILVILKHLESYYQYCNLNVENITDSDHIFSAKDKNLIILKKVRSSDFDASGILDLEKITKVIKSFFPDPEKDVNGYGIQRLFSILFQVENKQEYKLTTLNALFKRQARVDGFVPITNALSSSVAKFAASKSTVIVENPVDRIVTYVFDALGSQSQITINSGVVAIINSSAPGMGDIAAKNLKFVFENLWSGNLLEMVLQLLKIELPPESKANFANLRSLLNNKISQIATVFNFNLPKELISIEQMKITDLFAKVANNYDTEGKKYFNTLNVLKIKDLIETLKEEYLIYNALDERIDDKGQKSNSFKIQTLPALIKLNMNKGWYLKSVSNPGSKISIPELLGMPNLENENFKKGSFYEGLENLLSDDKSKNEYSGTTLKNTVQGLQKMFIYSNEYSAILEREHYLPILFSKSFKITEISEMNYIVGQKPEIELVLRYSKSDDNSKGLAPKQYVYYKFGFIQKDALTESIENSSFWTIKSIYKQ